MTRHKKNQRGGDFLGIGKFITDTAPGLINKALKESKIISRVIIPAAGVFLSPYTSGGSVAGAATASSIVSQLGYGQKPKMILKSGRHQDNKFYIGGIKTN